MTRLSAKTTFKEVTSLLSDANEADLFSKYACEACVNEVSLKRQSMWE